ncbi:ras-related protein Rab-20 [Microcaecilia unicolor]|uniref:Ras-related protein Rab-20 n=1 Tax=Microcaecilia unicolor TaxID=1415580 RepID=A0A6P7XPZ7_9AMPH|nr:ras-related protein Rab-20 [Microcaecilia unicolor]
MLKKPDVKVVLLGDMNVGKTSLLHRYVEKKFQETVSTVGGAFYLKQWGPHNISIWDTAGREQFHGLGSMYCRGAAAVLLVYDVSNFQSLVELEDRFLALTDTASTDCIFAIVGNKVDLTDECTSVSETEGEKPCSSMAGSATKVRKQVRMEDAVSLYKRVLKYKMLDEKEVPAAEKMCFETSAKSGHNVDFLFESLFDTVVPLVKKKANGPSETVDLTECNKAVKGTRSGCCK